MKEQLKWAETGYADSGVAEDLGAIASSSSIEFDSDLGGKPADIDFNSAV